MSDVGCPISYTTLPHRLLRGQLEIDKTRETSMHRSLLVYRSDSSSPPGPAQRADTDADEIFESQTMTMAEVPGPELANCRSQIGCSMDLRRGGVRGMKHAFPRLLFVEFQLAYCNSIPA